MKDFLTTVALMAVAVFVAAIALEPAVMAGIDMASDALSMVFQLSAILCGAVFSLVIVGVGAALFVMQQENERANRTMTVAEADASTTRQIAEVRSNLVYAGENGMMPVSMADVLRGVVRDEILLLQSQQIDAQRTHPNVPNSIHYSVKNDTENYGGLLEDQQGDKGYGVPSWNEIVQFGHLGVGGVSIGYSGDETPTTMHHRDFGTALIIGRSGSGKTNFARYLTAQQLFQNAKIYIADPEGGTPEDPESESLADALSHLPIAGIATTPTQINQLCDYISKEAQSARNKNDRLILFVDETNRLLRSSTTGESLTEAIYQTGAAGRKRGVFCWCFGQGASSKHVDTQIRDLFTSFVGFAGSQDLFGDSVRRDERDIMAELPKYHVLHMPRLGGDLSVAAVPLVSNRDLEMFRDDSGAYGVSEPLQLNVQNNAQTNVQTNAQEQGSANVQDINPNISTNIETNISTNIDQMTQQRVIQAVKMGKNITAIVRDVYGIEKRGAASQEAATEIGEIVANAFLSNLTEEKYTKLDELGLMLLGAFQDGQTINDVAETFGKRPSKTYMTALDNIYATIREVIA